MDLFKAMCYIPILLCALVNLRVHSSPLPDSAGIVEMPPGVAYGGIPYGSVTGMVADYYNGIQRTRNGLLYNDAVPAGQQPHKPLYYNN